ncbi:hypothetical protein, partial [Bacteroides sp.]|uniref:hypothetical protein n=1 Tax=Bacteroides sp. TaxID=29523 RepID=UPI004028D1A8
NDTNYAEQGQMINSKQVLRKTILKLRPPYISVCATERKISRAQANLSSVPTIGVPNGRDIKTV